jgi:DNA mismatch repair protein MLH3
MAYNANTWDNTHELSTGTNWTRTRLKALESEIADLAVRKRTDEKNSRATRITKEMLAKAQFVAQLNAKFIVILTDGGLLCILDQHAADERIGLERLEHALEEIVSTSNTSSAQTRNSVDAFLSKKGLMKSADILKDIPVSSQIISMSASNFTTLLRHKNSVLKWRFMFDITNEACREIRLTRVPCICGKSASTKDFLQFIQVLGQQHSLGTTTLMKPPFAKRILASHACRYAIMFGDLLTERRCKEMISNLAKCNLSFICAHGRPSIVPLIDLNLFDDEEIIVATRNNKKYIPFRSQKRMIKKKNVDFSP